MIKLLERLRGRMVDDVRNFWRWWSFRLNAIGLALLGWVQFDPIGALAAWNMMPAPVRQLLPENFIARAGLVLFGLSMLARMVKQPAKGAASGK